MKSKIFSTDQVRAIQDGRMTQFMQVVKSRHESGLFQICRNKSGIITTINSLDWDERNCEKDIVCPFGKVGDEIYCRETWAVTCSGKFEYKADGDLPPKIIYESTNEYGGENDITERWYSPATMPREAARLFLRITNIRVMRAQELTEQDSIKQAYGGICDCKNPVVPGACENCYNTGYNYPPLLDLKESNEKLWDANSWMWIIDFTKTGKP